MFPELEVRSTRPGLRALLAVVIALVLPDLSRGQTPSSASADLERRLGDIDKEAVRLRESGELAKAQDLAVQSAHCRRLKGEAHDLLQPALKVLDLRGEA